MRCLAPRAHRYQDARELAADLHVFLQQYSPQFITGTLASLVGVVLDRANYQRPAPVAARSATGSEVKGRATTSAGLGFPVKSPEPSWSTALTNPLNLRQGNPDHLPRARRAETLFDELFDELFEDIKIPDDPPQFTVEDPSKQIVISIEKPEA
jgi:hypothetical protein